MAASFVSGRKLRALVLLGAIACGADAGPVIERESRTHLDVLFVGNSYTFYHDMPALVEQVAAQAGHRRSITAASEVQGSWTLRTHWQIGAARTRIATEHYDYVVLQEGSRYPYEQFNAFQQFADSLASAVRAAGSTPVLFLTWAPEAEPQLQSAITSAYRTVAQQTGARIAPVGVAWQRARAGLPALNLYDADGTHPSALGSYLTAAVFYATLFGESPASAAGTADERALRELAWEVVRSFR